MVAGHSETKSLIVELLDGNRSEFGATLVTVSVFGVSGRGSRQQKLLEVLSWWPVQEIISIQHLWRVSSEVAYWCGFGNSQLLPACYLPFGPLKQPYCYDHRQKRALDHPRGRYRKVQEQHVPGQNNMTCRQLLALNCVNQSGDSTQSMERSKGTVDSTTHAWVWGLPPEGIGQHKNRNP